MALFPLLQNIPVSDSPASAAKKLEGLALAEEAVDDVIKQIELEMSELQPVEFASHGVIKAGSFGGADAAPALAMHYTRAHEVTWKTLVGLKADLEAFQQACRDAKKQIVAADEEATERNRRTQEAVDLLSDGSMNGQGRRDHRNAQQNQNTDPYAPTTGEDDL